MKAILFIFLYYALLPHCHPNTMSSFSCLRSNDTENNAERDDLEGKNPSFVSEDQRNYFYFHLYYFDGFRKQLVMSQ